MLFQTICCYKYVYTVVVLRFSFCFLEVSATSHVQLRGKRKKLPGIRLESVVGKMSFPTSDKKIVGMMIMQNFLCHP